MMTKVHVIHYCFMHTQLTSDKKWLPGSMSGRKAMYETLLGPFFSLSGLVDDSSTVKAHYYQEGLEQREADVTASTIQQRLSICSVCFSNICFGRTKHLYFFLFTE